MIDRLKSIYSNETHAARAFMEFAKNPDNPRRMDDLLTAAEYIGKVVLVSSFLIITYNDLSTEVETENLVREFDKLKKSMIQ